MKAQGQESVKHRQPGWSKKRGEVLTMTQEPTDWHGLWAGWWTTRRADTGLKLKTEITVSNPLALARL